MIIIALSLIAKISYYILLITNFYLKTQIVYTYFEAIEIISIALTGTALAFEMDLWLKYDCKIKSAGQMKGRELFETNLRSVKDLMGGFILIFVMIYLIFIAILFGSKETYNDWVTSYPKDDA